MAVSSKSIKNKIDIPMEDRPRCTHPGCNEPAQHTGSYNKHGYPYFRKFCKAHHSEFTAKKHGLASLDEVVAKKAGFDTVSEYQYDNTKKRARKLGFKSVTAYSNSTHPYRRYRKDYCENIDGRLGFKCTYTNIKDHQLDTDHINGDPSDNRPENFQKLCKNCHADKTMNSKDYATPGRKALKRKKLFSDLIKT
jgi:5-methylcytosine-specific restriction endonuclease McrA